MTNVRITLQGCDGSTDIKREMPISKLSWLQGIALETQKAGGGCDPTMHVYCGGSWVRETHTLSGGWYSFRKSCEKPPNHEGECGECDTD